MSELNTNGRLDSVITEIKAEKYIQHTSNNLTQNNQADLVSVKNDFYNTGKDTYNLTVNGKTSLDYGSRSRTFNGNVEEHAEGNLTEKCLLSATRLYLGVRNSIKIGPSFFTAAVSDSRIDIGAHVAVTTIGIGIGVQRSVIAVGATADVTGVQTIFGMTSVDDADYESEWIILDRETHTTVVEDEPVELDDDYAQPADALHTALPLSIISGAVGGAGAGLAVIDTVAYSKVPKAEPYRPIKKVVKSATTVLECTLTNRSPFPAFR